MEIVMENIKDPVRASDATVGNVYLLDNRIFAIRLDDYCGGYTQFASFEGVLYQVGPDETVTPVRSAKVIINP